MKYFFKCLYNYANFGGRARRKEFWSFVLYSGIIIAFWHVLWSGTYYTLGQDTVDRYLQEHSGIKTWIMFSYSFIYLFLAIPLLSVISRRFNDTDLSIHDFMNQVWCLILILSVVAVLISGVLILYWNNVIDYAELPDRIALPILIILGLYFFYRMIKTGTEGYNEFGLDPRRNDPIENAQKIRGIDADAYDFSSSSDRDFNPFELKR